MTEPLVFRANLANRQSSLMMAGDGQRCLIELEAFNMDAVLALVGLTKYAGRTFRVTIEEVTDSVTEFTNGRTGQETDQGPARGTYIVGRGGSADRRNQQQGGGV